jgi:hypothetical protein
MTTECIREIHRGNHNTGSQHSAFWKYTEDITTLDHNAVYSGNTQRISQHWITTECILEIHRGYHNTGSQRSVFWKYTEDIITPNLKKKPNKTA